MLSEQERKEMLEDAQSDTRRAHFHFAREKKEGINSIDDYLIFLNSIQKIFAPFKISQTPTLTERNIL